MKIKIETDKSSKPSHLFGAKTQSETVASYMKSVNAVLFMYQVIWVAPYGR